MAAVINHVQIIAANVEIGKKIRFIGVVPEGICKEHHTAQFWIGHELEGKRTPHAPGSWIMSKIFYFLWHPRMNRNLLNSVMILKQFHFDKIYSFKN